METDDQWTCFEFGLPYLLYQLEGPINFSFKAQDCRIELFRQKRNPEAKLVSIVDDPFGRTDYSGVRLCIKGLVALDFQDLTADEQKHLRERFGQTAASKYKDQLHTFILGAVMH